MNKKYILIGIVLLIMILSVLIITTSIIIFESRNKLGSYGASYSVIVNTSFDTGRVAFQALSQGHEIIAVCRLELIIDDVSYGMLNNGDKVEVIHMGKGGVYVNGILRKPCGKVIKTENRQIIIPNDTNISL